MKNVLSADQRCRPEDSGTLLSDITHKVHALTKKRGFNAAYLFPGCFPLIKKIVFITLGSQASFGNIVVMVNMNIFSVHMFLEAQSIN